MRMQLFKGQIKGKKHSSSSISAKGFNGVSGSASNLDRGYKSMISRSFSSQKKMSTDATGHQSHHHRTSTNQSNVDNSLQVQQ